MRPVALFVAALAAAQSLSCGGAPDGPELSRPAALRCSGERIELGLVVVARASVASTSCTNVGDVAVDVVASTRGDGFRPLQDRLHFEPGATVEVSVELAPRRAGDYEGSLELVAAGDAEPLTRLRVTGTGVDLADCVASLAPRALTLPREPSRAEVSVVNHGRAACLLEAIETRVVRGQVSVAAPPMPRWIPPMTALELVVDVAPGTTGAEATVELAIEHTLGDGLDLAVSTER